ncbi:hypothetical protein HYPDE_29533 [Hyphomicrobium denitrificans 1NES1]|uniref:Uncharacterized protein n=1 Tax=Hyphomicrobium denitrificans 1NES1 TaxID=670307 RepID=N0BAP3_9HYPH|nr:hypothetical protein HYPDE_29533 [Hyphomicrobium denitrificans 1NES1]
MVVVLVLDPASDQSENGLGIRQWREAWFSGRADDDVPIFVELSAISAEATLAPAAVWLQKR